jgi:hypothetical protein
MILQLGVFLLSLLLFASWGLPVAALRGAMPMMVLSAPAFGVALLAVVATVFFSFGIHLSVIAIGAVAVSLISTIVFRRTVRFMLSGIREAWLASCLVLVFSIIILAPVLADRAALTVFQANIADHFGYMATSVVYSQMDFQQILGATLRDHLSNPLLYYARPNLHARPAVSILFAVIGSLLPGAGTVGGYAFLCSFAVAGLLSFCAFLLQVFRRSGRTASVIAVILAGAYACGFWGQYPLDINAWSQVAVMPVLISAWTIVFVELTSPDVVTQGASRNRAEIAPIIALAILVAGGIYLYPEGISFHALVLAGAVIAAGRPRLYRLRDIALALILGAATSLLFWKGTLGFGANQIHIATTSPVAWWRYFDAYLFGMDPEVNKALLDSLANALSKLGPYGVLVPSHGASLMTGVSGVVGAYFLTPANLLHLSALDVAKSALLFLVLVGLVAGVYGGLRSRNRAYRLLLVCAGLGLLGAMLILQMGQAWAAGKALSFAAPLLCLAIVAPAMIERRPGAAASFGPAPWLLAQLCFVGMAVVGLSDPYGARLRAPYPADLTYKKLIGWDISNQLHRVRDCRIVKIIAPDPYYRQFVSIALFEARIPFFYTAPVNSYFGVGREVGHMPAQAVEPGCEVFQMAPIPARGAPALEVPGTATRAPLSKPGSSKPGSRP